MKTHPFYFFELLTNTLDGEWGEGEAKTGHVPCSIIRGTDFVKLNNPNPDLPTRWIKQSAVDRKKLFSGDIVLETAGGTSKQSTGRSALIKTSFLRQFCDKPVLCSSFARHLKIKREAADPTYLFYLMQSLYDAGYMGVFNIQHTGVSRFQFTTFKNKTRLFLPSLPMQKKISAILSAYDDLIENNNNRIAILEKIAEELYREWFVRLRFPGHKEVKIVKGLPDGWEIESVGKLLKFEKGKNPERLYGEKTDDVDIYLNVDSIENGIYQYASLRNSISCNEEETLMLMDGARSSIVFHGINGVVGSTFAVIRTAEMHRFMIYEYMKANLEAMVFNNTGSAIPHANKEFIIRMLIKLPKDSGLLIKFNEIYRCLFLKKQIVKRETAILKIARDRLLSRLMSGKIDTENMDIQFPASMQEELAHA